MRIAELAKPGIVAAVVVTGALVAWKWPAEQGPRASGFGPRPAACHREVKPVVVRPPAEKDVWRYIEQLPVRHDKVDVAFPRATIETNHGTLHCALFPQVAPLAVGNFVGLASGQKAWFDAHGAMRTGRFYDGLTFHRTIPGFMIQGGDPVGNGTGGPGYQFPNEVSADLKFEPGMLAMANAGPDTNGSQFFIMDGTADYLRGNYTIFGMCSELDVIHQIASVKTGAMDKPVEPVIIEHVTLTQY
jgi:peptidyl-prolyl cis-trans isomerase A (cyclophilin A)